MNDTGSASTSPQNPSPPKTGGEANDGKENAPTTSRIVQPLRPEEVRWFFKKNTSEKAWQPMNGRDSLLLEMAYRRHQATLAQQAAATGKDPSEVAGPHWAATAICLGGLYGLVYEPLEAVVSPPKPASNNGSDKKPQNKEQSSSDEKRPEKAQRFPYRLKPIYWEGTRVHVARGTWFLEASTGNWQPLDGSSPDLATKIEEQHLKMFNNTPIPPRTIAQKMALTKVLCEVEDAEEEQKPGHGALVRWYGIEDVLLVNHSQPSRLWRYLRLSPSGTRLVRGYKTEARMDDGPPPVTDLLFVIHGIGQKRSIKKIVHNVSTLRDITDRLLKTSFNDTTKRPMFLPVDWRSDLELDEHVIRNLTPNYLEHIRQFFNESLMDLMYYASPVHGLKIACGLSTILNRMYRTFISHDPGFVSRNGRVSLVAHSLGTVIAYDILSVGHDSPTTAVADDRIMLMSRAEAGMFRLSFPVQHMFCLGSPLGVFLAARRARGTRILNPPGAAPHFRLHNIYNPADPVAYRIEPLVSEVYSSVCPLRIHKHDVRDPTPYEHMPNLLLVRQSRTPSAKSDTPISASVTPKQEGAQAKPKASQSEHDKAKKSPTSDEQEVVDIPSEQVLPYRVDHVLKHGRIMSAYWAAITAHDSYWARRDVWMYVLCALYGMPKSPVVSLPKKKKH